MKPTLSRELAIDALLMAVWRRKPKNPVLAHSDQGSQYGSDDWRRFYKANNLEPSMSRRGNCWDNAVAESFFSSLKKERIRKRIYKTRDLARADIFDYIEVFYNRTRRHSHLGGVSPEPLNGPQREVKICLLKWGKSTQSQKDADRSVLRIKEMMAQGLSQTEMVETLNSEGYKTIRVHAWNVNNLRQILFRIRYELKRWHGLASSRCGFQASQV